MSRKSESPIRIRGLRGALSQGEFAKEVGVPQSRVSECESGQLPSVQMRVLLGTYAAKEGKYNDAIWFWKWAGLDTDALLLTASRLAIKRAAPSEIVPVPMMPSITGKEKGETPPYLQFDRSVIPNPEDTGYLRVPPGSFVLPVFNKEDLVVVDSSERDPWKLEGSLIAAYRPPELSNEREQEEFQRANTKEEVRERRALGIHPFRRVGLFIGFLRGRRVGEDVGLYVEGFGGDETEVAELVASWPSYYVRRDLADRGAAVGPKILGRVISWIPSASQSRPERGASTAAGRRRRS